MKAWFRGSLALGTATLFVSACVLVEDFQGYEPLGSTCDDPPCPDASNSSSSAGGGAGAGGMGGSGSSTGGGGTGGGGITGCAKIPCNGVPCMPELLVANSQLGIAAVDSESLFIRTASPTHIVRIAKPGCTVPAFDQLIEFSFPDQGFFSDGQYAAWLNLDIGGAAPCAGALLWFCDVANCQPQQVPVPGAWADQGPFVRMAPGPGYFYFTMRNGLVGRVAKGSTQAEQLFIDPANQSGPGKRGYLLYPTVADGKVFVVRQWVENAGADVCTGSADMASGAIFVGDAAPGMFPQVVTQSLLYPQAIAVSQNYVYFSVFDTSVVLKRVPKAGGAVETIAANGTILGTVSLQSIFVHNGWVYFKIGRPNDQMAIARLPAETPTFTADVVQIMVENLNVRSFRIDDDALYWDACADPACNSYRILAQVLGP